MLPILLLAATHLATIIQLPDVTKGVVDGKAAVLMWPSVSQKLVAPVNCTAHLVPSSDLNTELRFPCGQWFVPPANSYRVWLEQGDLISPHLTLMVYAATPFHGKGLGGVFDLVAGGRVQLSSAIRVDENQQLRLLHLDSHLRSGIVQRGFERRVLAANAHEAIMVPAGRVIGAITDAGGNALAVSRPLMVSERSTVRIAPQAPTSGSDVVVILDRPRMFSSTTPDDLTMTLTIDDQVRAPDVFVTTAERFYGFWYGITAAHALLTGASTTLAIPHEEIKLRQQAVATLRRSLKILPSARISLHAPPGAFAGIERSVDIVGAAQAMRHVALDGDQAQVKYLPAEQLRVTLNLGKWRFSRDIDLRDRQDADVVFDLQPIVVSGTIFRGERRAAGKVKFYLGQDDWAETTSDEDGHYEVTLWEAHRLYPVEIALRDDNGPPYREYAITILHSETRDFHIPDTHYTVHISDADSNDPVAAAQVSVRNRFYAEQGGNQSSVQVSTSNEQGDARLPPLRRGTASIVVRAAGYIESEPIVIQVGEDSAPLNVPIQLRQARDTAKLELRLPNGDPCAGAEVVAISNESAETPAWQSTSAADGTINIPKKLGGSILLIKQRYVAAVARVWEGSDTTWQLSTTTMPLMIRVDDTAGDPVRFANIIVWLDDVALHGGALRFLTDTPTVTDSFGFWRAMNLGGTDIQILAKRHFPLGATRSLAQQVKFPWPNQVTVRVSD
jgi:hypothetical protein